MNSSSLRHAEFAPLTVSALRAVALGGLGVTALAVAGHQSLGLPLWFIPQTLLGFLGVAVLLAVLLPQHRPLPRLGPANGVTLARGAVAALLIGLLGHADPSLGWPAGLVALAALILDGVDGHLARVSGMASRCGARFDMEVDALFVAVLALLVWQFDKAGAWVLLSGLMRYLFLAAALVWPALNRPLPFSKRRQTVCVIQAAVLILCLTPLVGPDTSPWLAAAALGGLSGSFARDTLWLLRQPRGEYL